MPTAPRPRLLAGLLAAELAVVPARAQPVMPAPAGAAPARAAAIANVPAGARVRLVVGGRRVGGRFQGVAGDTLVVRVGAAEPFRAPVAGVDTLWARSGRAAGRGAMIGAGLGGAALAGFALFLVNALCESPTCGFGRDEWTAVLASGAIGAAGGAFVGAGVGALVPTWRRVVP